MKKIAGKLHLSRETVHHLVGNPPSLRDAAAGIPPITVGVSCLACGVHTSVAIAC